MMTKEQLGQHPPSGQHQSRETLPTNDDTSAKFAGFAKNEHKEEDG